MESDVARAQAELDDWKGYFLIYSLSIKHYYVARAAGLPDVYEARPDLFRVEPTYYHSFRDARVAQEEKNR